MDDLIVYDEEYENYIKELENLGQTIEDQVSSYVTVLDAVCEYVITEGRVADNLKLFTLCAQGMEGLSGERIESMSSTITSFVSDIDTADEYIY